MFACLSIQWIDTKRNIDVCIYIFIPKLYPLRGPRNNDIYLSLRSWFLNIIPPKRNQSSLKWVDSKTEAGKMKNEPEAFCGFRNRDMLVHILERKRGGIERNAEKEG